MGRAGVGQSSNLVVLEARLLNDGTTVLSSGTVTGTKTLAMMIPSRGATPIKIQIHNETGDGTGTALITPSIRERGGSVDRLIGVAFPLAGAAHSITRSDDLSTTLGGMPTPDAAEGDDVDLVLTFDGGTHTGAITKFRVQVTWRL